MRSRTLSILLVVSWFTAIAQPAHADAPRAITAAEMQKLWDDTPPEKLKSALPKGAYRISGKVAETDDKRVYLATGRMNKFKQDEEIALRFASVPKVKHGAAFTATCEFHGFSEGGNVTLDDCKL
jgi:hypothetical protein